MSRKPLSASRNIHWLSMYCCVSSSSRPGTSASIIQLVRPTATPRISSTPPTVDEHSAATRPMSLPIFEIAVHDHLREERVERADGGGFHRRGEAAEKRATITTGSAISHFASHRAAPASLIANARAVHLGHDGRTDAPGRGHADEQHAGDDAADEQILDRRLRHDAVEDERQRRRQQQAERAGRGQQPERELLAIAVLHERGRAAPPSARIVTPEPPVNTVKNAQSIAHTTAVPPGTSRRARGTAQQSVRRAALGEQHADEREERNRGECGLGGELIRLDQDGRAGHALRQEHDGRGAAEQREDRRAGHRRR